MGRRIDPFFVPFKPGAQRSWGQQTVNDEPLNIVDEDEPQPPDCSVKGPRNLIQNDDFVMFHRKSHKDTEVVDINEPGAAFTAQVDSSNFAPAVEAMIPHDKWIVKEQEPVQEKKPGVRAKVLQTAESLVNGDRNKQYGPPDSDFRRTASFWQEYLKGIVEARGELKLEPHDVGVMMALLKVSRITWMPGKADSWVDLAGYAACAADCVEIEHGLTGWPS